MNAISRENKLGALSMGLSLLLHLAAVLALHSQTLWFAGTKRPAKPDVSWSQLVGKAPRHEILDVTFAKPPTVPLTPRTASALFESRPSHTLPHISAPLPDKPQSVALTLPTFPVGELLAIKEPLAVKPMRFQFENPTITLDLPRELILSASKPLPQRAALPRAQVQPVRLAKTALGQLAAPKIAVPQPVAEPLVVAAAPLEGTAERTVPALDAPPLAELPTLEELQTVNLSDAFEIELAFVEKEEGGGFFFALTLLPRADLELPKIRQHVTFLIDRSNSIQRERLSGTKNAVHKALAELQEGDTFNLVAFDSKVEKLFPAPAPATPKNLAQAETFLSQTQLGSLFSSADLYKPLLHTIPAAPGDDEIYTTILLTDGASLGKRSATARLLQSWTAQNQGRTSLYTIAMSNDPHLNALEATSALNKGKLLHATTNRGLKRKLLKLMKMIHTPVAKNIAVRAIEAPNVVMYPRPESAAPLYLDQPYVLLGSTDKLDDFLVFFQGRMKDRWLNIRKTVSFVNGKRGGHALRTEWALQSALQCYGQYAIDNDPRHLAEARTILEPFGLPAVME